MSAEKPLSEYTVADLSRDQLTTTQTFREEVYRLRARNRKLVEACRKALEHIGWEDFTGSIDIRRELRAAIEENDDGK